MKWKLKKLGNVPRKGDIAQELNIMRLEGKMGRLNTRHSLAVISPKFM